MASSVRTVDRGASRLIQTVTSTGTLASVDVGVLEGKGGQTKGDGGPTVAQIAEWAEFGIGQPMRSWLRDWITQSQAEILRVQREEYRRVLVGQQTKAKALARLGVWIVGQIQARIASGIAPPNAESTIRQKGSSTPLIDTGQLRSSITSRVNA